MSSGRSRSGGRLDREHVQPIVEVVAEALLVDHPTEIAVRRGDHAHVHSDRARSAEALEFLLLERRAGASAGARGDLADLVEEERPAVGGFEASDPLSDRTGEGAALVTEELALEETGRDRGAIQVDERPPPSRAALVDLACDELLARSRLALDQHDRVGRGDHRGLVEHAPQRFARPDDLIAHHGATDAFLDVDSRCYGTHRALPACTLPPGLVFSMVPVCIAVAQSIQTLGLNCAWTNHERPTR